MICTSQDEAVRRFDLNEPREIADDPAGPVREGGGRRKPYPSDITRRQWELIEGCLAEGSGLGRPRLTDLCEVVNAVNYRWTTGCAWRMLPHDFPPWETVYTYFRGWWKDGTLQQVRKICLDRRRCSDAKDR